MGLSRQNGTGRAPLSCRARGRRRWKRTPEAKQLHPGRGQGRRGAAGGWGQLCPAAAERPLTPESSSRLRTAPSGTTRTPSLLSTAFIVSFFLVLEYKSMQKIASLFMVHIYSVTATRHRGAECRYLMLESERSTNRAKELTPRGRRDSNTNRPGVGTRCTAARLRHRGSELHPERSQFVFLLEFTELFGTLGMLPLSVVTA